MSQLTSSASLVGAASASLVSVGPAATETLRVLHLVNGEHFSGAERVQLHLAHRLPEHDVLPDFACLKPGKFLAHFDAPHSQAIAVPMQRRADLSVVRLLADRIEADRYDLMHAHTPRSAMVAAMVSRRTGVPWVYHVHSPTTRDSARRLQNRINHWVERLSLRGCEHQITVSHSLRAELLAGGWPAERVTAVHNGVPAIRPPRQATPAVGGTWKLGMVALMRPRKGLEILLQALARSLRSGHDVRLQCIGPFVSPEYEASIRRLVAELQLEQRVQMTGFASDVPKVLSRLDALVLPSLYGEGLPMVVLEAMAAGLPIIATRVEGTPEAVRHEVDGLLATPADADCLARQINRLVTGHFDWTAASESVVVRHAKHFSDAAMAAGVAGVYRRILEAPHPRDRAVCRVKTGG